MQLTEEMKREILDLAKRCIPKHKIAEQVGCTRRDVYRVCHVDPQPNDKRVNVSRETLQAMQEARRNGATYLQIAVQFNVSTSTAYYCVNPDFYEKMLESNRQRQAARRAK